MLSFRVSEMENGVWYTHGLFKVRRRVAPDGHWMIDIALDLPFSIPGWDLR